jgi:DNA-binding NarL/FixJ family response regulator
MSGMNGATVILVADSDQSCRKLILDLLRRIGFEAAEAATGPDALEQVARLQPRLVVLEINLAEVSGYEVCRELRDEYGDDIAVIFISGERTTAADRVAGLLVGADDYIVKPFDDDELLARVRAALRRVASKPAAASAAIPALAALLTAREREVLRLLARGLNQTDIATSLFISPKTVGGHIQRVLTKLGVHSRAQAVALAHEEGLTEAEDHALASGLQAL